MSWSFSYSWTQLGKKQLFFFPKGEIYHLYKILRHVKPPLDFQVLFLINSMKNFHVSSFSWYRPHVGEVTDAQSN